jgi:glycosyltransferase involved in cell wall biosynthesis
MQEQHEYDLSVVIPTLGRTSLARAVQSVDEPDLKVQIIVVSAGPQYTQAITSQLSAYPHLLLISDKASSAFQRDLGVAAATGKYIAFLDDDDEWSPNKCTTQISLIESTDKPSSTISGARVRFRRFASQRLDTRSSFEVPTRNNLAKLLLARKTILYKGNSFGSTSLLGASDLIRRVRWHDDGVGHDDWGYLLRLAESEPNIGYVLTQEVMCLISKNSPLSVSKNTSPDRSEAFLRAHRSKIDKRSAADFWLLHVLGKKIQSRTVTARDLLGGGYQLGAPHFSCILKFLTIIIRK